MTRSDTLFEKAQQFIPGGVDSPVRAFKHVERSPLFLKKGEGAYVYDEDDNRYIDYVCSWGAQILGHAHPAVIQKVQETAAKGLHFGACHALEGELAELICEAMPAVEQVRFVNSGTEAAMTAIRLARGFTGRKKIIKFSGGYHGHLDAMLVEAGSGALEHTEASSLGIPPGAIEDTLIASYNDIQSVENLFDQHPHDIAAVIVEPVAGNMGCIAPVHGFLSGLRTLCEDRSALLIFDEVMTGFRVGFGGAQTRFGIFPDLTMLGKIIGGGMPAAAVGGRTDIMQYLAPIGDVYQAGTLSGNPIAMAAGVATLNELKSPGFYTALEATGNKLMTELLRLALKANLDLYGNQVGGMFGLFFTHEHEVTRYDQVLNCNKKQFLHFYNSMLEQGIYFPPSPFEAYFFGLGHGDEEIEMTLEAAEKAFEALAGAMAE